jgi:hypothetical protein
MMHYVPYEAGSFLINWATSSSWKRSLLHGVMLKSHHSGNLSNTTCINVEGVHFDYLKPNNKFSSADMKNNEIECKIIWRKHFRVQDCRLSQPRVWRWQTAFWDVALISFEGEGRSFIGAYCLTVTMSLIMKAVSISETSVNFYKSTLRNI